MTTSTIKELAEELGTSKTTIKNLYSKLGIEPSKETRKNQAVVVLSAEQVQRIKEKYKANRKKDNLSENIEPKISGNVSDIEFYKNLITTLQKELQTEREHNRQLQDKLAETLSTMSKNQLATSQNALIDKASGIIENQEPIKKHWFDRFKK